MFTYYGSKARIAKFYPEPLHPMIVEPFAGSAKYACQYPEKQVVLFDVDPRIVRVWRYLIGCTSADILKLPLAPKGVKVDDLDISDDAKLFLGYMISAATRNPKKTATEKTNWMVNKRQSIADFVEKVHHWRVGQKDFRKVPDVEATWFVDPPYQKQGQWYDYRLKPEEYSELGDFCQERKGQVIVCENAGADWLPFRPLVKNAGQKNNGPMEVIWTNTDPPPASPRMKRPRGLVFCEALGAGVTWHIRQLSDAGIKASGGADTPALCGVEVSWDLHVPLREDSIGIRFICDACRELYKTRNSRKVDLNVA